MSCCFRSRAGWQTCCCSRVGNNLCHLAAVMLCRHFRDVCWWLEHVCGINMLDYEEKVVVSFILLAVLILLVLGAYKQSTRLVFLLKQMLFPSSH